MDTITRVDSQESAMPSRNFFDLFLGMNEDKTGPSLARFPKVHKPYATPLRHRSTSKASFPHEPLPTPSSFRILELLPGAKDTIIKIRLREADWNDPPAYEAISYCWGSAKDQLVCICESVKLSITRSLYEALMAFRQEGWQTRMLWADAIW